jgi:drug/metabolite transporter (DMT)-like permease
MALLASAATFIIYYRLLQHMTATSLSFIIYIIPVVAIIGDYLIYGQVLSIRAIAGMFVIFSGIWLSQRK